MNDAFANWTAGLRRALVRAAPICWGILITVTIVATFIDPDRRSVVVNYRYGTDAFFSGVDPYHMSSLAGYLYAPAFAVLFAPFWLLGPQFGDALWKVVGFFVFAYAGWRQTQVLQIADRRVALSAASLLALPLAAGAVANGQATILMAGATWLMFLAADRGAKTELFFWAILALIAKPTSVVALLMVGGMFPRHIPVLVAALVAVFVIPFAFAPWSYVQDLTQSFLAVVLSITAEEKREFNPADFTAMFTVLSAPLADRTVTAVRVLAALATSAASLLALWRFERRHAVFIAVVLAAFYVCLFNPRQEGSTYAALALPFATALVYAAGEERNRRTAAWLSALLVAGGLTGIATPIHQATQFWFKPAVSIVVFVGALTLLWRMRAPSTNTIVADQAARPRAS